MCALARPRCRLPADIFGACQLPDAEAAKYALHPVKLYAKMDCVHWTRSSAFVFFGVLIAFHKPYGVLCQFTPELPGQKTLAEFGFPKNVYPIGRLDADSEGLLLLSDEPGLNHLLLHPRHAHQREYWVQVERVPESSVLERLCRGVVIQGRKTLPCRAWILDPQPIEYAFGNVSPSQPNRGASANGIAVARGTGFAPRLPPRQPPIRFRKNVPTCWIAIELVEGKNRQVRRMTAAVGHPTLRLLRVRIGQFWLNDLPQGKWRELTSAERALVVG